MSTAAFPPLTPSQENLRFLWKGYEGDQTVSDLSPLRTMAAEERAVLLRHHYQGGVSEPREIHLRGQLDNLLHLCGVMEIGIQAGALEDSPGLIPQRLTEILDLPEVRTYFQQHYPLRLPARLRSRFGAGRLTPEGDPQPAWFARLLSLDRTLRDPQLEHFLRVVDGFWYRDVNFPKLQELAKDREALLDAVATPRDDRDRTQEVLAGLERFLFFCRDLTGLMEATPDQALSQSAFDLYRYWFDVRQGRLNEVVEDALTSLSSETDVEVPVELPERQTLAALFDRARRTSGQGRALAPLQTPSLRELMKLDSLAIRLAQSALPVLVSERVRDRIAQDYATDIGAVAMLRAAHHDTGSVSDAARFYWSTRRDFGSPRLESLIAAVALNFAASALMEAFSALIRDFPADISDYLVSVDVSPDLVQAPQSVSTDAWNDMARLMRLYRLRATDEAAAGDETLRVATGAPLAIAVTPEDQRDAETLRKNLDALARGMILDVGRSRGALMVTPTNGVMLEGLPAATGDGWGLRLDVEIARGAPPQVPYVLFTDDDIRAGDDPRELDVIFDAAAVVVRELGVTSHTAVLCRSAGVPCVSLGEDGFRVARLHPWLLVKGGEGKVYCYVDRPDLPTLTLRGRGNPSG